MVRRVEAIEAGITSSGPAALDFLDEVARKERGRRLPDWPVWCWYPAACAEALTDNRPDQARMVAAIGAWRQGRFTAVWKELVSVFNGEEDEITTEVADIYRRCQKRHAR